MADGPFRSAFLGDLPAMPSPAVARQSVRSRAMNDRRVPLPASATAFPSTPGGPASGAPVAGTPLTGGRFPGRFSSGLVAAASFPAASQEPVRSNVSGAAPAFNFAGGASTSTASASGSNNTSLMAPSTATAAATVPGFGLLTSQGVFTPLRSRSPMPVGAGAGVATSSTTFAPPAASASYLSASSTGRQPATSRLLPTSASASRPASRMEVTPAMDMSVDAMQEDSSAGGLAASTSILPGTAASATGAIDKRAPSQKLVAEFGRLLPIALDDPYAAVESFISTLRGIIDGLDRDLSLSGKRFEQIVEELKLLKLERDTWLLLTLLQEAENGGKPVKRNAMEQHSEKRLIENLHDEQSTVRLDASVIKWLETIASFEYKAFIDENIYEADMLHGWQNSLDKLKRKRQGLPDTFHRADKPNVNVLDPDAPLRTGLELVDPDGEDDMRLMKKVFTLIRTGRLDKAKELCRACGQSWRAATMDGHQYWHDPANDEGVEGVDAEGNWYRSLWKATCLEYSNNSSLNMYERAAYGALCGNLPQLLRACTSWQDAVWAHFKVMLDQRHETEILSYPNPYKDEPASNSAAALGMELTPEKIFAELRSSKIEAFRRGAEEPIHIIHSQIILSNIDELIKTLHGWIAADTTISTNYLRFFAHLVVFFRSTGQVAASKNDLCDDIMAAYAQHLVDQREDLVIARYAAQLPFKRQTSCYASFLRNIKEKEHRLRCLEFAAEAGLNVQAITKEVVETIRAVNDEDAEQSIDVSRLAAAKASTGDKDKISAIDWLVFDPAQRIEALKQGNAVMRGFISVQKINSAWEVFDKIPADSVAVVKREWMRRFGKEQLSAEQDNIVHEYLSIKAYLESLRAFEQWANTLPTRPSPPAAGQSGRYLQEIMQEKEEQEFRNQVARWEANLANLAKTAQDKIFNVLLFPNGWMMDRAGSVADEDNRQSQMDLLRKQCLPELCILLHRLLHTSERYVECLQLADLIAADKNGLCQVFQHRKEELRTLLLLFRSSALKILETQPDPLGYN